MDELRVIIVEDEEDSRIALSNMLTKFCKNVEVLAQAESIQDAIKVINQYQPDLVFLDIEMPKQNGFMLFDYFEDPAFDVVFTTAYDQYAVKAFKFAAVDYLLKPIDLEELRAAIEKVKTKRNKDQAQQKLKILQENLNNVLHKIALPTTDGLLFVELKDIIYCEAQGNYTVFYLTNEDKIIVSKTLKIYDELLYDFNFFRINRSNLVNLNHIRKFGRQRNAVVTMANGVLLSLSENRKKDFLDRLNSL
ncbi:MAG: LytTR family DNA-binding domain-containing protein [Bacteroidota bacterium]